MLCFLAIIVLSTFALAQQGAYTGCYRYPEAVNGKEYVRLEDYGPPCPDYCFAQGTLYSYRFAQYRGDVGIDEFCACSDEPPDLIYETGNQGTCFAGTYDPGDVSVDINASDWLYLGCYSFDGPPGISTGHAFTPCNEICAGHQYMLQTFYDGGGDSCACVDDDHYWAGLHRSDCYHGTDRYVYQRVISPSAAVRRAERLKSRRHQSEVILELCPDGMTACNVLYSEGLSYECLDTQQELESCGGCLFGEFKPRTILEDGMGDAHGTDCTALPGVDLRGITCQEGRCLVHQCEEGFVLIEGMCQTA
ncbi:hypothetical protein IAU59_005623 [Kwoniella sp. CBS 9459]